MNASSLPTASRLLFDELLLQPNLRLRVGEHLVDIGALRIVTRPEHPRLTSKAAAVLIELVRHAGDTVMRDQLLDRVWADRVTTPDAWYFLALNTLSFTPERENALRIARQA